MTDANCVQTSEPPRGKRLLLLSLAALGIVYGDIGTSPLYAVRECFHGEYGIAPQPENVLGVLSLMFWALVIIVSVKYLTLVLRADNHGEGGVMALTSLIRTVAGRERGARWILVGLGLFAASLLYGDGMITPAISVLSAVEGLRIITPVFEPWVMPVTVAILTLLFWLQSRGTARVGSLFGPVTVVWMAALAALGIRGIAARPDVLIAVNPVLGIRFLAHNGLFGFLVLGAVFLVVTGAEALYADLGHFGRKPIRLTWFMVVLPALLLNYFGQGALLLARPEEAHHPFYSLVPQWFLIPMVVLATLATIIASQAVISAAFSITHQAIQLGYLPRMRVVHTSATQIGQIYVPQVNAFLGICTIALVLGFQSSSRLAAAYGVAVTTTMSIESVLFYAVARNRWGWSRIAAGLPAGAFLVVDLAFFGANISKITHGAWFPLLIGGAVFTLMTTWRRGRDLLARRLAERTVPLEDFLSAVSTNPPPYVSGKAVYLAKNTEFAPLALSGCLRHNKVLHEEIAVLTIHTTDTPRVERDQKVEVEELAPSVYRITSRFGFMEEPNVPYVLALVREKGPDFPLDETSFFLGRERLFPAKHPSMPVWRNRLFAFLTRNALGATTYFKIPPERVIEVGTQIEI